MKSLSEYYAELLPQEVRGRRELISDWVSDLIKQIKRDFRAAARLTRIKGSVSTVKKNSTNQSIGNQMAKHIAPELNLGLLKFTIENCPGSGYPDRVLARGNVKNIALEMKATSKWTGKSNRIVLTSSSRKLRNKFESPVYHLLLTVIY